VSALIAGPFVSLLLVSTVLGMLLGVFGIGAVLMLMALGFSFAIVLTGALLSKVVVGKPTVSLLWLLLGAITFHAVLQIPILGLLTAIALISMAIGGLLLCVYRALN